MIESPHEIMATENYPRLAMVKPVFTATAYNSYYNFYYCIKSGNCKPDDAHSYLTHSVINSWSTSTNAKSFITQLKDEGYPADRISIISDIDVHQNNLYDKTGSPKYDSIVFFHSEYISKPEYHNTINFIKSGGNVVILNGNAFFGIVDYDQTSNNLHLVEAHNKRYDGENGTNAGIYRRFVSGIEGDEHFNWFGSRYCAFNKGSTSGAKFVNTTSNNHPVAELMINAGIEVMASSYNSHEENCLITSNAHIIAEWKTSFDQNARGIKIYEMLPLGPIGGSIIHFGFFGTDILYRSSSARKTFVTVVKHQTGYFDLPWIRYPIDGASYNHPIRIDYTAGWNTTIFVDRTRVNLHRFDLLNLAEGSHNLSIVFRRDSTNYTRTVLFDIDQTNPEIDVISDYNSSSNTIEHLAFNTTDRSPEQLFVSFWDYNTSLLTVRRVEWKNDQFTGLNLTDRLSTMENGTWIFRIEAVDSAGNTNQTWYQFDKGKSSLNYKMSDPVIRQLNQTTAIVSIKKLQDDEEFNIEPQLQLMQNYSFNWTTFSMRQNATHRFVYVNKTTDSFWYRISVNVNNSWHRYFRPMRTFYWDSQVVKFDQLDLNYQNSTFSYNISIQSELKSNWNYSILITDQQGFQQQYHYIGNTSLNGTIQLEYGLYRIQVLVDNNQTHLTYQRQIGKPVEATPYKMAIPTEQIDNNVVYLEFNDYDNFSVFVNVTINHNQHQFFNRKHTQAIKITNALDIVVVTLSFYDFQGNLIRQILFEVNMVITTPTLQVNSSLVQSYVSRNFSILWNISADTSYDYSILIDDVVLQQDQTNKSRIVMSFNITTPGVYTLKLMIQDKFNQSVSIETELVIASEPYHTTPITDQLASDFSINHRRIQSHSKNLVTPIPDSFNTVTTGIILGSLLLISTTILVIRRRN